MMGPQEGNVGGRCWGNSLGLARAVFGDFPS